MDLVGGSISLAISCLLSVGSTDGCLGGLWGIPCWDLIGSIQNLLNTGRRTSLGVGIWLCNGCLCSGGCCGWLWSSTNAGCCLSNLWDIPGWELIGPV